MNPKFIAQITISEEHFRLLTQHTCKMWRIRLRRIVLFLWGIIMFIMLTNFFYLLDPYFISMEFFEEWLLFFVSLILSIVCITLSLNYPLRLRRFYRKIYTLLMNSVITYTFYDTYYTCESSSSISTKQYDIIESMHETNHAFILRLTDTSTHLIAKSAFILGTPEAFRAFFETEKGIRFKSLR